MKYKVGDKVLIKSLDWYNMHCDDAGNVDCGCEIFEKEMKPYLGKVFTIHRIVDNSKYEMEEAFDFFLFTDEMIEGLAKEETKPKFKEGDRITNGTATLTILTLASDRYIVEDNFRGCGTLYFNSQDGWKIVEEETKFGTASNPIEIKSNANCFIQERVDTIATKIDKELPYGNQNVWELPDGYRFIDENGNVINATKIVLEKKKKEYPKTYEECCDMLGIDSTINHTIGTHFRYRDTIKHFINLLICRDAYWKIAGEEMGLDKPWEPSDSDYITGRFCIFVHKGNIICDTPAQDCILTFPTEEMRDAFYENFKELINSCKELL